MLPACGYSRSMLPSESASQVLPEIAVVYERFVALMASVADPSSDLGGALLLYAGLDAEGTAVVVASNIAGAASLGLEPDAGRAKAALRAGVCDFVVNSLDEALRILKNEIRQRRAVSVVLTAERDAAVAEIVERGVQPEILAFPVPELQERGAGLLAAAKDDGLLPIAWSVERESPRWLPVIDKLAVSSLASRDSRVRWIESAPRYLGRAHAGQRYLRMAESELGTFVAAVRAAIRKGAVPERVKLTRSGEQIL